ARIDESLALCRKLLEYRVVTRGIRRIPAPGGTEHLGNIVGRHLIEDLGVARAFVEKNLLDPRGHADRIYDIEHLLTVITGRARGRAHRGAGTAESADQYVLDRDVRSHACLRVVELHVACEISVKRKDADRLARAGERPITVVGCTHVTRQKLA